MNNRGIQSRKRFGFNKLKTKVCNKETFVLLNWAEHLMKQSKFLTFCLIAAFAASIPSVVGQVINPSVQNVSLRTVTSRSAPVARSIANTSIAPHVAPRPTGFNPRIVGSSAPHVIAQPGANLQRNYSPPTRTLNPTFAALRTQRGAPEQQPITLDPATRQTELRTLAAMRDRRGFRTGNATLATINPQPHSTAPDSVVRRQRETQDPVERTAKRYPAYGYDPLNSYYDYDGPVYTYSNLLPDEVIANVQTALQDAGYYFGAITGSLSLEMRAALANFQRDYGLQITGAIDEATVETLGLY